MLLQTNSYIVPREKRAEHARILRRFRQTLQRLGCDHFEVYEQVGANWNTAETTGRFVQIMRFRDRKHQMQVQGAERSDPQAQQVVREFCELINFPYQQQQGLFAVGYYTSFLRMPTPRPPVQDGEDTTPPPPVQQTVEPMAEEPVAGKPVAVEPQAEEPQAETPEAEIPGEPLAADGGGIASEPAAGEEPEAPIEMPETEMPLDVLEVSEPVTDIPPTTECKTSVTLTQPADESIDTGVDMGDLGDVPLEGQGQMEDMSLNESENEDVRGREFQR